MSCVLNTMVFPSRRNWSTASLSASAFTGSSPLNGSSRITSSGSATTLAMNWTFCAMPFDSASIFLSRPGLESERAQPALGCAVHVRRRASLQPPVVTEQSPDRHLLVKPALFRQVAHAIARGARLAAAEHLDLSFVRQENIENHPDRRRLAGAVRADEPVDRAGRDLEREPVDGDDRAEAFGDVADANGLIGCHGGSWTKGLRVEERRHCMLHPAG